MVVLYTDEQLDRDLTINGENKSGYSLRRTGARVKTREARDSSPSPPPPPAERKRTVPASSKMGRIEKKIKTENAETKATALVAGGGGNSDESATFAVEKSAYAKVTETLRKFNKYYLNFIQAEETRCAKQDADLKAMKVLKSKSKVLKSKPKIGDTTEDPTKKASKRPDLKATAEMRKTKAILYPEKRIGSIPGIDVGHQFFSRAEMVVVGFHQHWLGGIDFIGQSATTSRKSGKELGLKGYKLPLAVSIVLSGQYEDDLDNCEEIVYTGQGGNNLLGDKRQIADQELKRGNLGLKNCMEQSVPVRVIRGHKCQNSYVGKVYTYDGLYRVRSYWAEKGVSGFTVYKFSLKRDDGQPPLTTKEVYFTRGRIPNSISEIRGLVCEDIAQGLENIHIPVTNLVDDSRIEGFVYIKNLKFSKNVRVPTIAPIGCDCRGSCADPRSCACAKLNGGVFPYVHRDGGRLVEPADVVFECGPNCGCGPDCVNKTSQRGLRFRLEVFRTPKKGWGVRSWDYIPSGAPICEYIGLVRRTADLNTAADNSYVFDIDCLQTMKGLNGRESRLRDVSVPSHLKKIVEESSESVPFCIDAAQTGNLARFINHSCQPNLFVQCVLSNHHDIKLARVMLIAADNIPPLKELTYDYGYELDSVLDPDGTIRQMPCFCGADGCRKRLY
ncbi:LOW QUALITY PROTEIN: histone-lysine N-methyltransferase, H3 lysine-9 specific SUVH4-like [Salvia miltiorrhiza]|uniref:LOW QUALITY PROTEIN: histone-lysine N-methyltransferase, H3 lysine-9 specific SUVH4-like n=1 Tax=Salvia miltiorrhiza TaxID=226208 RepID=UPI0025ACFBC6|nr:LOW QUALITY PROTEIN: histone-lysine N-methyltransferase, H3 lysine-9 specific SUVH4-like [Salvia miltiorrhiza]